MRTNIDIDDDLIREAMRASGATTKRAVVEQGLRPAASRSRRQQRAEICREGLRISPAQ